MNIRKKSVTIFVMVLHQGSLHFLVRGAGGQIPNKVCNFCQYPAGGLRGTGGKVSDKHCLNSFVVSLSFESPHFEFINAALGPH